MLLFGLLTGTAHAARKPLPPTSDWRTATMLADRVFPGTRQWLLACSSHEGGWTGFVRNYEGSASAGWMQFVPGTYDAFDGPALAEVRRRGFTWAPGSVGYYRPLGQALVAAYMRAIGVSHVHWDPRIDRNCW